MRLKVRLEMKMRSDMEEIGIEMIADMWYEWDRYERDVD